jgi:hypothetical protein
MTTKFKIQIGSVGGWADMKSSDGESPYEVCLYDTKEEAQEEIDCFIEELEGQTEDDYRIVPESTEAEFDLYD